MKIGILTLRLGHNYGGILQNWALQQVLSGLGHKPVTIQYSGASRTQKLLADARCVAAWSVKQLIRHRTRNIYILPWQDREDRRLKRFVRKEIKSTSFICDLNEAAVARLQLDVILVGSDQTWRPLYSKTHFSKMFCCFLPASSVVPRVAYAASFGVDNWEFNNNQTKMAKEGLAGFKAISVRESSGVDLCKRYLDAEAVQVLDPTLLIGPDTYARLTVKEGGNIPGGRVGVYILDDSEEKRKIVERVCEALGKEAVWFGCVDEKGIRPSIGSWLSSFDRSDFIVTDSFHGTVFSINYQTPFLTILNNERGKSRFTSLLDKFGLADRAIATSDIQQTDSIIRRKIDWNRIGEILDRERVKSLKFLTDNLNDQ